MFVFWALALGQMGALERRCLEGVLGGGTSSSETAVVLHACRNLAFATVSQILSFTLEIRVRACGAQPRGQFEGNQSAHDAHLCHSGVK